MPAVVPRGNPDGPRLEVADDAVDYWSSVGYVLADGEKKATKSTAKKSTAKRSSSSKK